DRTLFFDFLPLELGSVRGFKTRFHLYTVPGQVYYVSTRRAVLTGVDGVIFVADSQEAKLAENIESLEDLEKNLSYYGKKIEEVPMLLQYNKRDMKNLSAIEVLNEKLNKRKLPFVEASAYNGRGVMETLTMITKAVLENLEDSSRKPKVPLRRRVGGPSHDEDSAGKLPPPLPPRVTPEPATIASPLAAEKNPPLLSAAAKEQVGTIGEEGPKVSSLAGSMENETIAEEDAPAFGLDTFNEMEFEDEPEISDSLLEFGDDEETVTAEEDEGLELSEYRNEDSGVIEQPLEFDEDAVEAQGPLDLDSDNRAFQQSREVLELDEFKVTQAPGAAENFLTESEKAPLEIELPADELTLESEPAVYHEEELDLTIRPLSENETNESEELFEEDLLELEEPALPGFAASEESGEDSIEIIHCGEAQKLSRSAVQIPLVLKLNRNNDRVSFTLTVQLAELLKRNG
ncbi:MAG TPA: GTPase domain-containing protein, partial [Thermodesulfobacteriota bacterium]|nr:GTPase domain-containing protein [Thermodesulfobacteriota bacterium]